MSLINESLLTLHDAAQLLPRNRAGKPVNFATVWRWVLRGIRAANGTLVRLEAVRLGGRWVTSREALERFAVALTPTSPALVVPAQTPSAHTRAARAAKQKLAKKGI